MKKSVSISFGLAAMLYGDADAMLMKTSLKNEYQEQLQNYVYSLDDVDAQEKELAYRLRVQQSIFEQISKGEHSLQSADYNLVKKEMYDFKTAGLDTTEKQAVVEPMKFTQFYKDAKESGITALVDRGFSALHYQYFVS